MADDKDKHSNHSPRGSRVDSLIDRLNLEIPKDSDDDLIEGRRLTIHSTNHRHEMSTNSCHDIDREITELETLIKKLQSEIVEMTKSANKPLPNFEANFLTENDDEDDDADENININKESNHSPAKNDEEKDKKRGFKLSKGPHNPDVFPIIIKNDSVLEAQAKMFAENMANLIKISDPENGTLDDVRRNFSMLWDDEDDLDDIESISDSPPKPLNDPSFKPSDSPKTHLIKNVFIESLDALNISTQEELSANFPVEVKEEPEIKTNDDDETQTKLKDPDSTDLNGNSPVVLDKRSRNSTIIMQANTLGNPLKDNIKKVNQEKDSGITTLSVTDKPTELKTQKAKSSIYKTNDDNTQTKLNDHGPTEFNGKASVTSGNRNRNPTIIMQANTSGKPLKDNIKKVNHEKETATTSLLVTDTSTEDKTERTGHKTVITTIKNAMQNMLSSSDENTSISNISDKSSESYSIIRTLRRIVGKDSNRSIHNKDEKETQDMNKPSPQKESIIIKDNPQSDTQSVMRNPLPKLSKEMDTSPETTPNSVRKRNYEIVPLNNVIEPPAETQPACPNNMPCPTAPSASNSDFANCIKNNNMQTQITLNTQGTSPSLRELENKMEYIDKPEPKADDSKGSTLGTIPDAFSSNVVVEDAKTVLRNSSKAAVKKTENIAIFKF
ncbi:hypothetical protein SFRURICE_017154 [Spodoptera frugiperda]|nr:hypothetical protein SFRURICE_017154 [Spodoptera frugiperda]